MKTPLTTDELELLAHVCRRGVCLGPGDNTPLLRMYCYDATVDVATGRAYSCLLEHAVRNYFVYEVTFADDEEINTDIADEKLGDCGEVNAAKLLSKLRNMSQLERFSLLTTIMEKQLGIDLHRNLDSHWTV